MLAMVASADTETGRKATLAWKYPQWLNIYLVHLFYHLQVCGGNASGVNKAPTEDSKQALQHPRITQDGGVWQVAREEPPS